MAAFTCIACGPEAMTTTADHGALMDSIYRGQRHIYDLTRKYYLFGRDTMIGELGCQPGDSVLEIGCGTGRNLSRIAGKWPGVRLHGLDISREMLKSASRQLGKGAVLVEGDAAEFSTHSLFRCGGFDRVVLSFALSMIPDWEMSLTRAIAAVGPKGSLHVVDFGDLRGVPQPLRAGLRRWLRHFHVTPRAALAERAQYYAGRLGMACKVRRGPLGYFQMVTITDTLG
jgi:S-adenosylmethionine-diacylgycerolhomoserine-N-methlytransferase